MLCPPEVCDQTTIPLVPALRRVLGACSCIFTAIHISCSQDGRGKREEWAGQPGVYAGLWAESHQGLVNWPRISTSMPSVPMPDRFGAQKRLLFILHCVRKTAGVKQAAGSACNRSRNVQKFESARSSTIGLAQNSARRRRVLSSDAVQGRFVGLSTVS